MGNVPEYARGARPTDRWLTHIKRGTRLGPESLLAWLHNRARIWPSD